MKEIQVIRVNNITVAKGYKCKECGVIRPFHMEKCFCDKTTL